MDIGVNPNSLTETLSTNKVMKKESDMSFDKKKRPKDKKSWIGDEDQFVSKKDLQKQYKRKPKHRNSQDWDS